MTAGYDSPIAWALLIGAGVVAGFVNTMAGGGSLLTLPALMLLGLPANVANGSNRLGTVTQSISGVLGFHREGRLPTGAIGPVALPTIAGASVGALAAALAPNHILEPVLLTTMTAMALLMAIRPNWVLASQSETPRAALRDPRALLSLFAAGLYGGFVQAGVGFVLLTVLGGVLRYDVTRANALKLACTLGFGTVALGIFIWADQVAWLPATVLAAAAVLGSQLGVRFAVKVDKRVIRWILLLAVVASSAAVLLRSHGMLSR